MNEFLEMELLWFALPLLLVICMMPLVRLAAVRIGFVDRPGGRKKHEMAVPPIGGLVIFPVFMAVSFFVVDLFVYKWFYLALALLLVVGALDDRLEVQARFKFITQFIAAFLIVVPGQALAVNLGNLTGFGDVWLGWGAVPFSVIAAVLLINAINLMDGLDGLSGGIGFIIIGWLALACGLSGNAPLLIVLLVFMGAMAGFLVFNMRHPWRKQASVFIGDAGSLALGLTLAWFALRLTQDPQKIVTPIAIAWFLTLPIYDTCAQFARRVSQGRHPFDADHDHFHHHFIYAGLSMGQATAVILSIVFLTGLIGMASMWLNIPEWVAAFLWAAGLLVHIFMSLRPHRYRRIFTKLFSCVIKHEEEQS